MSIQNLCIHSILNGVRIFMCCCFVLIMVSQTPIHAQRIYGTMYGGESGPGNFFSVNDDRSVFTEVRFPGIETGAYLLNNFDRVIKFSNGKVYGIMTDSGESADGALFEYDPSTGLMEVKKDFNIYSHRRSASNLFAYKNELYFMTDRHFLCAYNPVTNKIRVELTIPTGVTDFEIKDDVLLGFTPKGGGGWAGSIFEYNLHTKAYTVLFQFEYKTGRTGRFPIGKPARIQSKIYGVTYSDGIFYEGTLFEFDLNTRQFKKLHDFKSDYVGGKPIVDLQSFEGMLIGRTTTGGLYNKGTYFSYDVMSNSFRKLRDNEYDSQVQSLRNIDGKLYGYDDNDLGSIYTFDPHSGSIQTVLAFTNQDQRGYKPQGIVTIQDGETWGITSRGGRIDSGVLFSYNLTTQTYLEHFHFDDFPKGRRPIGSIVQHETNLYGLTSEGGEHQQGTIYSYDTANHTLQHVFSFPVTNESIPYSWGEDVQLKLDGNELYGIHRNSLFIYDLNSQTYEKLHTFYTSQEGIKPLDIVKMGDVIVGLTKWGGNYNQGVSFIFQRSTNSYTVIEHLQENTSEIRRGIELLNSNLYTITEQQDKFVVGLWDVPTNQTTALAEVSAYDENNRRRKFSLWKSGEDQLVMKFENTSGKQVLSYNVQSRIIKELSGNLTPTSIIQNGGNYYVNVDYWNSHKIDFVNYSSNLLSTLIYIDSEGWDNISNIFIPFKGNQNCSYTSEIDRVVEVFQGSRRDGKIIDPVRSDPWAVVGRDYHFYNYSKSQYYALGFGGYITLAFNEPLCDTPGSDFIILEESTGNPVFGEYPEQAEIYVSQDGEQWFLLSKTNGMDGINGSSCNVQLDTWVDFSPSSLPWIQYVHLKDISVPKAKKKNPIDCLETSTLAFNGAADGFDLKVLMRPSYVFSDFNVRNSPSEILAPTATVFPNPVVARLSIDLDKEIEMVLSDDYVSMEIIDLMGRVWLKHDKVPVQDWKVNASVDDLKKGVYVVCLMSGNVKRYYKLLKD